MRTQGGRFILAAPVVLWLACCGQEEPGGLDGLDEQEEGQVSQALGACSSNVLLNGIRVFTHFANPDRPCLVSAAGFTSASGRDLNILNEFNRLIKQVPAGGIIRGHIYQINAAEIAQSLYEAQSRGVAVYISTDPHVALGTDAAKAYLDKLNHLTYCSGAALPCIGTSTNASAASHVKVFTFSRGSGATQLKSPTGGLYNEAVWIGSANQTYGSGSDMYNNAITLYGSPAMVTNMNEFLMDMWNQVQHAQYYDPANGRGYWSHASGSYYASPSPSTDLIVLNLNKLTPNGSCKVRTMQNFINDSRPAVVDKLVAMKKAGCTVMVVANSVAPTSLAKLKAAGIPVRKNDTHDKVFLLYGKYGTAYQFRVLTGSHNVGITANDANEELLVEMAAEPASADASTRPFYNAYYGHFYDAWNTGTAL